VDYDLGAGEQMFESSQSVQPEQRIGLHASHGRLTLLGHVGLVTEGSAYQSAQSGEVLVSLTDPARKGLTIAAGGGVLHEAEGTMVLLVRSAVAHEGDTWRLHGNVLLQKPFDPTRDAIDLITSVGWGIRVTPSLALGVEGIAEDIEGFWEADEAEGGARLLVGPSVHIAPHGRRWQLNATGGPTFHPDANGRSSGAIRDLPPGSRRVGYAVKTGITVRVF
jgi:hypothetical protein